MSKVVDINKDKVKPIEVLENALEDVSHIERVVVITEMKCGSYGIAYSHQGMRDLHLKSGILQDYVMSELRR